MDTALLIGNRDMPGLVTTDECIEAMEQAYLELGGGAAQELPRRRIYHPRDERTDHYYWFNEMAGILTGIHTMALLIPNASAAPGEAIAALRASDTSTAREMRTVNLSRAASAA